MINTSTTPVTADLTDLANASVRELLAMLTHIEDRLRTTPFLIPDGDAMVVNPEVAPLLSRQRSVVAQLRVRRDTWRGAPGTVAPVPVESSRNTIGKPVAPVASSACRRTSSSEKQRRPGSSWGSIQTAASSTCRGTADAHHARATARSRGRPARLGRYRRPRLRLRRTRCSSTVPDTL